MRRLQATPLAPFERDGLAAALGGAGLPAADVGDPQLMFWRFETYEDIPVGFGGLEIHGRDALLRSVVTLPPLRRVGMGAAIVGVLEGEARARKCGAIYLLTSSETVSSGGSVMSLASVPAFPAQSVPAGNSPSCVRRRRPSWSSFVGIRVTSGR